MVSPPRRAETNYKERALAHPTLSINMMINLPRPLSLRVVPSMLSALYSLLSVLAGSSMARDDGPREAALENDIARLCIVLVARLVLLIFAEELDSNNLAVQFAGCDAGRAAHRVLMNWYLHAISIVCPPQRSLSAGSKARITIDGWTHSGSLLV